LGDRYLVSRKIRWQNPHCRILFPEGFAVNQEEICRFICQELPRHRLQSLLESIEAAFSKSDKYLKDNYQHVALVGPGPQSHHFMVQEALLRLPADGGFEVINRTTRPAGITCG